MLQVSFKRPFQFSTTWCWYLRTNCRIQRGSSQASAINRKLCTCLAAHPSLPFYAESSFLPALQSQFERIFPRAIPKLPGSTARESVANDRALRAPQPQLSCPTLCRRGLMFENNALGCCCCCSSRLNGLPESKMVFRIDQEQFWKPSLARFNFNPTEKNRLFVIFMIYRDTLLDEA